MHRATEKKSDDNQEGEEELHFPLERHQGWIIHLIQNEIVKFLNMLWACYVNIFSLCSSGYCVTEKSFQIKHPYLDLCEINVSKANVTCRPIQLIYFSLFMMYFLTDATNTLVGHIVQKIRYACIDNSSQKKYWLDSNVNFILKTRDLHQCRKRQPDISAFLRAATSKNMRWSV